MRNFFYRLREVWSIIGITLLLLIFVEVFFKFYYAFNKNEDSRLNADCYKNASWVNDYYKEFNECNVEQWKSYVYWRRKSFAGKYINIDSNQRRKTVFEKPENYSEKQEYRIFMFGGSTMWGTGVRDKQTIASQLGRLLSENGHNVDIVNFGESGYVSTQEVIELSLQLQQGNIPDMVIFYDGVNDIFSTYQQGGAGIPQNEFNRKDEFNALRSKKKSIMVFLKSLKSLTTIRFITEFTQSDKTPIVSYTDSEAGFLAQNTIDRYNENIRIVYALAEEYGFDIVFYWQPAIFSKTNLSDYEKQEAEKVDYIESFVKAVNGKMIKQEVHIGPLNFYDISDIFLHENKAVFIDYCHISEYGNSVIAKRMEKDVISIINNNATKTPSR
ncbi:MAG: hypothetical protein B6D61_08585 [Bacteroidetes bacterium 4484_249]|nr:MAG: hypothetical protein B6D61_08585 [Bacteroidetes bacterium 4484_249]